MHARRRRCPRAPDATKPLQAEDSACAHMLSPPVMPLRSTCCFAASYLHSSSPGMGGSKGAVGAGGTSQHTGEGNRRAASHPAPPPMPAAPLRSIQPHHQPITPPQPSRGELSQVDQRRTLHRGQRAAPQPPHALLGHDAAECVRHASVPAGGSMEWQGRWVAGGVGRSRQPIKPQAARASARWPSSSSPKDHSPRSRLQPRRHQPAVSLHPDFYQVGWHRDELRCPTRRQANSQPHRQRQLLSACCARLPCRCRRAGGAPVPLRKAA